ncbi:hypothetical protein JCM5350_001901 [Sporobolomyces pararoseus]
MVLQNKHKQLASKQYKKSHGLPLNSSSSSTSTTTNRPPRETGQERALRLGSNADRYEESDDDLEGVDGDPDEVDEELLAHKKAEEEALQDFLSKQQTKLASTSNREKLDDKDEDDIDDSFSHLRINNSSSSNRKGKVVMTDSRDAELLKGIEGEARRAQAIRDLKDRFSVPSPPPLSTKTSSAQPFSKSKSSSCSSSQPRKPPPLPGMKNAEEPKRGGEDFLDSLL